MTTPSIVVAAGLLASLIAGCSGPDSSSRDALPQVLDDLGSDEPSDGGVPADLATTPPDLYSCSAVTLPDPHAAERASCTFAAGATVEDTLGLTAAHRQALPIKHLVIVTQENRSFDHFFGALPAFGQPDVDDPPAGFTNPDANATAVAPYHLAAPKLPVDPPHQGDAMVASWHDGKMDGFVKSAASASSDGHFVMGYYDGDDLPFFYWLANTFAIADRYFASSLAGTWSNRDYLYAATSDGIRNTGERILDKPTIFDALDKANVSWGVYANGTPRQDCLGWTSSHAGVHNFAAFKSAVAADKLPAVSFVDPAGCEDEHPTNDIHGGEQWLRTIYASLVNSPGWASTALIITFDEAGGLADHAAPPAACPPSADQSAFNHYGIRVPTLIISPFARRHYVSHAVHDHTSVLRLIEVLNNLPALTARDANADALLDMFDFACAPSTQLPTAPAAGGTGMCL